MLPDARVRLYLAWRDGKQDGTERHGRCRDSLEPSEPLGVVHLACALFQGKRKYEKRDEMQQCVFLFAVHGIQ